MAVEMERKGPVVSDVLERRDRGEERAAYMAECHVGRLSGLFGSGWPCLPHAKNMT